MEQKKYIKERIERDLKLLDKLQEIRKDIDNETDRLKIMISILTSAKRG